MSVFITMRDPPRPPTIRAWFVPISIALVTGTADRLASLAANYAAHLPAASAFALAAIEVTALADSADLVDAAHLAGNAPADGAAWEDDASDPLVVEGVCQLDDRIRGIGSS
jgi:hypothetical protein